MSIKKKLPSFDELPLDKSGPPGNAWGLWGPNDNLGRLNLLDEETTCAAALEIRNGLTVRLDYPIDQPSFSMFDRLRLQHEIKNYSPATMNDDMIRINTQSTTQWDGFRHFGYQSTKQFYMGCRQEDFQKGNTALEIDAWARKKGGIIGRGVLLDWYGWATGKGVVKSPFDPGAVTVNDLKEVAKENNITFKSGDILFVRVGFSAAYIQLSAEDQQTVPDRHPGGWLGLEASEDMLRWLWENEFAALGSDSPSLEAGPPDGPITDADVMIHQWCLAGWGLPLGELFDLERLAEVCKAQCRWTFFCCSLTMRIPRGVATPGNTVAIF